MLKGINQGSFVPETPLERIFALSLDAGFDAVELGLKQGMSVHCLSSKS